MIPAKFIWLSKFPLTANGKIDKRMLPKPDWSEAISGALDSSATSFDPQLAEIWANILGKKPVDAEDNFFTLGGHSLSVLRLLLAIEKQYAIKLNVTDIIIAPTLGALGKKIQLQQAGQSLKEHETLTYMGRVFSSPIVPLQKLGKKTPLFLLHPMGGTVFWFIELAHYLGNKRPIYGLQDPAINAPPGKIPFESMQELAAFYLHAIRKTQPTGPYLLAGSSFGATCVFELAKQLTTQGEHVAFLGLLDGWAIYPIELQNEERFAQMVSHQCEAQAERFQVNQLHDHEFWIRLQQQRSQLLWTYALTTLEIPLTLFKAQEFLPEPGIVWPDMPDNGWGGYSTLPMTVYSIPGGHETMFYSPNVEFLAKDMQACLDRSHL